MLSAISPNQTGYLEEREDERLIPNLLSSSIDFTFCEVHLSDAMFFCCLYCWLWVREYHLGTFDRFIAKDFQNVFDSVNVFLISKLSKCGFDKKNLI